MSYAEFKARARMSLKGNWVTTVFVLFVYTMINGIFSGAILIGAAMLILGIAAKNSDLSQVSNWGDSLDSQTREVLKEAYGEDFEEIISRMITTLGNTMKNMIPVIIAIIIIAFALFVIVGSMTTCGLYKQYYNVLSGEEAKVGGLFGNISLWPKMLTITLVRYGIMYVGIVVVLFSGRVISLVVVPILMSVWIIFAIVIMYTFIMAPFVLIDKPELGAIDCLKESASLMKGHKMKIFGLNVSFIGWSVVASIIGNILSYILPIMTTVATCVIQVYVWIAFFHYYMYLTGQDRYLFMQEDVPSMQYSNYNMNMNQGINQNYMDINQGMNQNNIDINQGTSQNQNMMYTNQNDNKIDNDILNSLVSDESNVGEKTSRDLEIDSNQDDIMEFDDSLFSGSIFEEDNN